MRLIDADTLKESIQCSGTDEKKMMSTKELYKSLISWIDDRPTIEFKKRKTGKWTEKHHAYSDEESVIEEWQSCRCSECGRYDTRPYMYYFSEPNYCSYCGADMRGK